MIFEVCTKYSRHRSGSRLRSREKW